MLARISWPGLGGGGEGAGRGGEEGAAFPACRSVPGRLCEPSPRHALGGLPAQCGDKVSGTGGIPQLCSLVSGPPGWSGTARGFHGAGSLRAAVPEDERDPPGWEPWARRAPGEVASCARAAPAPCMARHPHPGAGAMATWAPAVARPALLGSPETEARPGGGRGPGRRGSGLPGQGSSLPRAALGMRAPRR